MYTSWKHLLIKNELGLRDTSRLKKLPRARGSVHILMILAFALGALISFALAVFFVVLGIRSELDPLKAYGSALAMLALGASFVLAVKLFWQERNLDPIRCYLVRPGDFEFAEGVFDSFSYSSGGNRRNSRILVEGKVFAKTGEELLAVEHFSPDIWPFTTSEADAQIKKGDEWYDLKGKRLKLPVKAYFIYEKADPTLAALVGIDEELIRRALKSAEK